MISATQSVIDAAGNELDEPMVSAVRMPWRSVSHFDGRMSYAQLWLAKVDESIPPRGKSPLESEMSNSAEVYAWCGRRIA